MPPPITGQALAVQVLYEHMRQHHDIDLVDFGKDSIRQSIKRVFEVLPVVWAAWRHHGKADAIYLTISESFFGNLKDVCLYLACSGRLSRMYVHLHGGTIKRDLWDAHRSIRALNHFFIKRFAGVIISGQSHLPIFEQMIERRRIHIVPNFVQDHLFVDEQTIRKKFTTLRPMRILFLSAMIELKGYLQLTEAYRLLDEAAKQTIRIDFAGKFETKADEDSFIEKIRGEEGLRYHGIVTETQKQALFREAHLFCLPTAYFEGQPISILEAYAAGCVVLTTEKDGISDIFAHGVNGYLIKERSREEVAATIVQTMNNAGTLLPIALANRRIAGERYRTEAYTNTIREILERRPVRPPQ